MKTLFKSTSSLLCILLILTANAFAKGPVALVNDVHGNVFAIKDGMTRMLKAGAHVHDFSEIVTEEGAQVTFTDYYDHKFHMSGSGHLKIERNTVELKRGYVWLQSYNQKDEFVIKTANSKVDYRYGEAIVSFDSYSGKTQVLSVKGNFDLSNVMETHLRVTVSGGQFSFVDNEYEMGAPRIPTPIGEQSFKKITSLFDGVAPSDQLAVPATPITVRKRPSRGVASAPVAPKKSDVMVVSRPTKKVDLNKLYAEKLVKAKKEQALRKKKFVPNYRTKSGVILRLYGQKVSAPKSRMPASYKAPKKKKRAARMPASAPTISRSNDAFESSLVDQYKKQMRHENEVNSLIEELQNYDQDYQKDY